jgi:hypothetical protein
MSHRARVQGLKKQQYVVYLCSPRKGVSQGRAYPTIRRAVVTMGVMPGYCTAERVMVQSPKKKNARGPVVETQLTRLYVT